MFVTADPHEPSGAIVRVDEPDEREIEELVADGFVVRTEADTALEEARTGDTRRRDLAFATGAQVVVTDFPVADPSIDPDYVVQVPGGKPARCSPARRHERCRSTDVENPRHLTRVDP